MKKSSILYFSVVMLAAGAEGVIREVPGEHATVQEAIDAAIPGDVIVVWPGEYDENINFRNT